MALKKETTELIITTIAVIYGIYGVLWLPFLLYSLFAVGRPSYWMDLYKNKDWSAIFFTSGLYLNCLWAFIISISLMKHLNWSRFCVIAFNAAALLFIIYDLAVSILTSGKIIYDFGFLFLIFLVCLDIAIISFFLLPSVKIYLGKKDVRVISDKPGISI